MPRFALQDKKVISSEGLISAIAELALARGADLHKLLRGTGIFSDDLLDPHSRFSHHQLMRLLAQYHGQFPHPDAGFLLGQQLLNELGTVGQALLSAPTVGDSLRMLQRLYQHIAPLVHVRYHLYQRQVHVFITPTLAPESKATELLMQAYSSAFYALLKRLSQGYPHCHFDFACKRPRHMYEFEHNLGTRLRFAQPVYKWSFAASMLRCTNDNVSLLRWQRLQSQPRCESPPYFIDALCQLLSRQPHLSLAALAQHMAMSPATFKRKLKEHGWRFSQLQQQQQTLRAVYLLSIRDKGNDYVANRLAFYDTPNFRRAFKRWTGLTPSELKESMSL
ncbi:AraC family transcriptional regulator ligand-binding domain-containing protein [Pseudoalteromonas sp. Cnat2-41]|uniref:AraC family transcriptional regulator n=1 Tax=unclassified Pseudoalteromonas TaxID=194690 RepID=UPI001EF7EBA0|nr:MULTISPECIES: AraC family transcriptional regulator [unclassified Pseudoalteromonas]MCF2860842.1 AraC family transcriptional regulator [Pseudoalteromonas sp. CNAT2-18]MCG7556711.1 AraC family transcriptional regulator [Pseudoalteromonas sp. CNAT2-18.1]